MTYESTTFNPLFQIKFSVSYVSFVRVKRAEGVRHRSAVYLHFFTVYEKLPKKITNHCSCRGTVVVHFFRDVIISWFWPLR